MSITLTSLRRTDRDRELRGRRGGASGGAARGYEEALSYLGFGLRDTELLPAEQRMVTTRALMNAILGRDLENGIAALDLFVRAANDAYTSPHQGRFEPDIIRKRYSKSATTFTDSALILANRRCLCEVVDTGRGRAPR